MLELEIFNKSESPAAILNLPELISKARDSAILGEYRKSLIKYREIFSIIANRMHEIATDNYLNEKWNNLKIKLQKEVSVILQAHETCQSFLIDEEHPYRFRDASELITIDADRTLLKQAVRILVDNAAKYTDKNDEIILGVGRTEDDRPYLMVQDTGIGMTQTDVEHMFERFYRADEARSFQGTGLGLSIAKWIVDRHGGHFEIVSRTELGTRIMIVLT